MMGGDPVKFFEILSKDRGFFFISDTRTLREPLTRYATEKGITNGQITRDQFMAFWKLREQETLRSAALKESGADPKAASDSSGKPAVSAAERNEALMAWAESEFKRRDRNDDGYLNTDEVPDALKSSFAKWDKNNDNLISLNEFRAYFQDRFQSGARDDAPTTVTRIIEEEDLDIRPTVFRAGNLPKELPKWFQELDTDKDGQVALHEWRAGRKDLDEFRSYDTNDDGLLTPEEVLKYEALAKAAASPDGGATTIVRGDDRRSDGKGGFGGFGGGNKGGFGGGNKGGFGGGSKGGFGGFGKGGFAGGNKGGFAPGKGAFGGPGNRGDTGGQDRGGVGRGGFGGDRGGKGGGFRLPEFRRPN